MEMKATLALKPGMVIGEDVLDHRGNLVLKKDTVLDKINIQKLNIASILCVNILEPEDFKATYFEKIKVSKTFEKFASLYNEYFLSYKNMMDLFVKENVPMDNGSLLNMVHKISDPFSKSKITILDMLAVYETTEQDFLYTHGVNVALICYYTAKWFKLTDEESDILTLCGFYYDIGKFKIPSNIINKRGKLTDEEFIMIKSHAMRGYMMVMNSDIDIRIKAAVLMHHERCDGSGYPQGLTDEKIDKFAKIISILDAFDAMTSYRSYRAPLCPFKVIEIFEKDGLGKYDTQFYLTFLARMVDEYIGKQVQLSDGQICSVVLINNQKLSKPMVMTADQKYIDLSKEKNLSIEMLV